MDYTTIRIKTNSRSKLNNYRDELATKKACEKPGYHEISVSDAIDYMDEKIKTLESQLSELSNLLKSKGQG